MVSLDNKTRSVAPAIGCVLSFTVSQLLPAFRCLLMAVALSPRDHGLDSANWSRLPFRLSDKIVAENPTTLINVTKTRDRMGHSTMGRVSTAVLVAPTPKSLQ